MARDPLGASGTSVAAHGSRTTALGDLDNQVRHYRKPFALCSLSTGLCFTRAVEGSDRRGAAGWLDRHGLLSPTSFAGLACAAASVAILAANFLLASRINVNWDEFFFLSHVYALERGELGLFLQGAYTHAFRWITGTGGHEVDQIVRLRLVMCALLVVSAASLYALARLWTSRAAALVAVLAFLASWPVLRHGASFRADAFRILPLTLAAFFFTLREVRGSWRNAAIAGCCLGVAFVVTVKSVLLLPALAIAAVLPDARRNGASATGIAATVRRLALIACIAAAVAAALLALHSTAVVAASEPAGSFASRAHGDDLRSPIRAPPRFPVPAGRRGPDLLDRRIGRAPCRSSPESLVCTVLTLALLPLLFYRNAFPYYYPIVMAPVATLFAVASDWLLHCRPDRARRTAIAALAIAIVALMSGAYDSIMRLRFDGQSDQRAIVAAVHRIFPEPVPSSTMAE